MVGRKNKPLLVYPDPGAWKTVPEGLSDQQSSGKHELLFFNDPHRAARDNIYLIEPYSFRLPFLFQYYMAHKQKEKLT